MKEVSSIRNLATLGLLVFLLTSCVYTGSETQFSDGYQPDFQTKSEKNIGEIIISEGDKLNYPYRKIGQINAFARSVNLLSSDPTRSDIDEALRAEAAKIGADAIISVQYHTERQGLTKRGHMLANGQAVVFLSHK